MSYKISTKEIDRIIGRLDIVPADSTRIADPQEVRVAAVQMPLNRYPSLAAYVTDLNSYVADGVNRRAQLICFPAFTGLLSASLLPQFESVRGDIQPDPETGLPDFDALIDCLSYHSDWIFDAYFHTMSSLAARHGVCIMAGTTLYFDQDTLRHRSFLFGSDGGLVGYQDKLSLSPLEIHLKMDPAHELKTFDTPVGPVAMLACEDADYFEVARVARNMGAQILLNPSFIAGDDSLQYTLGLNMRVQETQVYGVQSVLIGETGLGPAGSGAACIYGPVGLTPKRNGIVAEGGHGEKPEVLCATLSLMRLAGLRNDYIQGQNPDFLEKYYDRFY